MDIISAPKQDFVDSINPMISDMNLITGCGRPRKYIIENYSLPERLYHYFVLRTSIINYNMQDTGSVLIQSNIDQRTCGLR